MTDKERFKSNIINNGLEVSEVDNTLQWTNPNWTCIAYFDENGKFVKMERVF